MTRSPAKRETGSARVRAAGYVRVSQERAAKNGYGLAAQEQDVRKHIEYKGWEAVEVYQEEGVSGYERERPALERLLADAKAGRFSVVVFPSIDRAGRSVKDVIEIDQALRETGVKIVFLREGIDTATPTGELFRNIMAAVAQFEGRLIHERLLAGKRRKAAEGGYVGGWLPYGFRRGEDGSIQPVPEEQEIIQRIRSWRAEGMSLRWIARRLEADRIPTRNGGRWQPSTIRGFLVRASRDQRVQSNKRAVPS